MLVFNVNTAAASRREGRALSVLVLVAYSRALAHSMITLGLSSTVWVVVAARRRAGLAATTTQTVVERHKAIIQG